MQQIDVSNDKISSISQNSPKVGIKIKSNKRFTSNSYHESEIQQNENIIKNAIRMIWVGIAVIVTVSAVALLSNSETTLLVAISGVFIDFYAATIIYLANKSSESKQKYFENLLVVEHEQRIISLIQETDNNDRFQCDMVAKIVDNHCNRST